MRRKYNSALLIFPGLHDVELFRSYVYVFTLSYVVAGTATFELVWI